MPKIDIEGLPVRTGSTYPAPHDEKVRGRSQVRLGDPSGLTQFGVNLVRLAPGAMSSLRHWHERQDEFLVVTEGNLTLVDDTGETPLTPGDCCAFPAGDPNGHHIVNNSDGPGAFVVVGTRTETETGWYSDLDLKVEVADGKMRFLKRNGEGLDDT
ncbi:cupin domain-containing protein [Antarctobacter jejuensis]|uniref:cupin domain-containing protein n=1 Tax=Antarctobacter jejuensis TaxID=1439938 RepID=UPI003FD3F50A